MWLGGHVAPTCAGALEESYGATLRVLGHRIRPARVALLERIWALILATHSSVSSRIMALELISGVERGRRWRVEEKLRIVAETEQPGVNFLNVARRYNISNETSPWAELGCRLLP